MFGSLCPSLTQSDVPGQPKLQPWALPKKQEHLVWIKQDEVADGAAVRQIKTLNMKFEGKQRSASYKFRNKVH